MELIVCNSTNTTSQKSGPEESLVEASFCIPVNNRLQLDVSSWHDKAADYLTFAVARFPHDLCSHVRRISLLQRHKNEAGLQGALIDLFIALQGKGRQLRERMLTVSKPVLREENYVFLSKFLDTGLSALDALPSSRYSVLSKGVTGTSQLVQRSHTQDTVIQDPLAQAHDHIEYGQLDIAMDILESAILETPSRQELHLELLGIYRATNEADRYLAMRERLGPNINPSHDAWMELAGYLRVDV
ncbi:hypothetical protein MNBD_GAMMA13-1953 [hydrothermal vent metagenome]|uniref:Uncharacterized protein n=1 Tax=hydrothermal vent metagenome TaxID=652676 RepID=A0A3B0Z4U3_9ZZZZ